MPPPGAKVELLFLGPFVQLFSWIKTSIGVNTNTRHARISRISVRGKNFIVTTKKIDRRAI